MFLNKKIFNIVVTLFFLTCLFGCSKTATKDTAQIFLEAQNSFEEAENLPKTEQKEAFRRVALTYQNLVDKGIKSGPIYYNMGNAWARCDETGQAIAAYQQAKRYMPLNPYIVSNLQVLGSPESSKPIIEHLLFWQDWIGVRQKYVISIVLVVLTFAFGIVVLFLPHRRIKRVLGFFLVLALISLLSTGYDWYRYEYCRYAVVSVSSATPRKGNSEQYELAFTMPPGLGAIAEVLDRRGNWLRLRFAANQDAWLPQDQVVVY